MSITTQLPDFFILRNALLITQMVQSLRVIKHFFPLNQPAQNQKSSTPNIFGFADAKIL
jgi:hypothetical protein